MRFLGGLILLSSQACSAGREKFNTFSFRWLRSFSSELIKPLPDTLLPIVAIVGRPNVGKSALYNRLIKRKEALVYNTPAGHVTRDYQEGIARLADLRFKVLDTSGLEPSLKDGSIQARAAALTAAVLNKSDIALLLVDGRTGILPSDMELARWMRRTVSAPVVLAANKCEMRGNFGESELAELEADARRLGYGDPVAISAETGDGMAELYEALRPQLDHLVEARLAAVQELQGESAWMPEGGLLGGAGGDGPGGPNRSGSAGLEAMRMSRSGRAAASTSAGSRGSSDKEELERGSSEGPLRVAIMGLPNVGKSTLTNWLLGEERCLTGPEPGLTRDAIKARFDFKGHRVELVDTAGWLRRAKLAAYDDSDGAVAAQTVEEGRTVMQFVHVVALVVDALRALELGSGGLTHREVQLAADAVAEGRALLLVVNKLDALTPEQRQLALRNIGGVVERALPDAAGAPMLAMSALTGQGAQHFMPSVLRLYELWNRRVPTSQLNRWIEEQASGYEHSGGGKEVTRVRYLSQVKARPPSFVAFVSGGAPLTDASQRFLLNLLRRRFGFKGIPIRLMVRYNRREGAGQGRGRGGRRKKKG